MLVVALQRHSVVPEGVASDSTNCGVVVKQQGNGRHVDGPCLSDGGSGDDTEKAVDGDTAHNMDNAEDGSLVHLHSKTSRGHADNRLRKIMVPMNGLAWVLVKHVNDHSSVHKDAYGHSTWMKRNEHSHWTVEKQGHCHSLEKNGELASWIQRRQATLNNP